MCDQFVIQVRVKPKAHQPTPSRDELDELGAILDYYVNLYLERLAEEEGGELSDMSDDERGRY